MNKYNDLLWTEKYRPKTLAECILPDTLKKRFMKIVEERKPINMILNGTSGTGKTTVARAMANELGVPVLFINASNDRNIDMLRGMVTDFVTVKTVDNEPYKMVIFDEGDNLNSESTQTALRAFMEEFADRVVFVITSNRLNKITPHLQSRCSVIDFDEEITPTDRLPLARKQYTRIVHICNEEGVDFEKKALGDLVKARFPDMRSIINFVQSHRWDGIHEGNVNLVANDRIGELVKMLCRNNVEGIMRWVKLNSDYNPGLVLNHVFDAMPDYVDADEMPLAIQVIAEGQRDLHFAFNRHIQLTATLIALLQAKWEKR